MIIDEAIEREKRLAEEQRIKGKTWDKEYAKRCEKVGE